LATSTSWLTGRAAHLYRRHERARDAHLSAQDGETGGFTKRYGVDRIVYFEPFGDIQLAIAREKQIKNWKRSWKIELIEKDNPDWTDLYSQIAS
jgi:predicted GIY-YIG superfamily endonuclease